MSDIREIIDLTEQISKNSESLVSKIIELSFDSRGSGFDELFFGFIIALLGAFIGYLLARFFSLIKKNCDLKSQKILHPNQNLILMTLLSLLVIGLITQIALIRSFSVLIAIEFALYFAGTALIFGTFFAGFVKQKSKPTTSDQN